MDNNVKLNNYNDDSIVALTERDKVRKRPDVWLQCHDLNAVKHTVIEILGNSMDEYSAGHGDIIEITRHSDHSISVRDYGRGIPMGYNTKEQKHNWELLFFTLFAGGKYDDSAYEMSVGLNGVGLAVTQLSSEYMNVEVRRDNTLYKLHSEKGILVGAVETQQVSTAGYHGTGTLIHWKPDEEIFTDIQIEDDWFNETLTGMALVSNVKIIYRDDITGQEQEIKTTGYLNHIKANTKGALINFETFEVTGNQSDERDGSKPYKFEIKGALTFVTKEGRHNFYHNMLKVTKGIHHEALTIGLARAVKLITNKYVSQYDVDKYTEKVACFIVTRSAKTSYDGQAKRSVLNKGLKEELIKVYERTFNTLFTKSKDARKYFIDLLEFEEKKAKEQENIEKQREKISKILSKTNSEQEVRSPKFFVDCGSTGYRELYIVEGDSALGACKNARNPNGTQAIAAVRGKIRNCLKVDIPTIAGDDVILNLVGILGERVEIRGIDTINFGKKPWDKIIICTDADEDGFQIRTLILTLFYRLYPSVLKAGKVYIAESPLFEIQYKNNLHYSFTNEEKAEFVKELEQQGIKYKITRSKGLGENDPEMMWETTMNPETRRLIQVVFDPDQDEIQGQTKDVFDTLLGENLEERKIVITDYLQNISLQEVV